MTAVDQIFNLIGEDRGASWIHKKSFIGMIHSRLKQMNPHMSSRGIKSSKSSNHDMVGASNTFVTPNLVGHSHVFMALEGLAKEPEKRDPDIINLRS